MITPEQLAAYRRLAETVDASFGDEFETYKEAAGKATFLLLKTRTALPALIAEVERLQQALIIAGHREDTAGRDLTPEEMRGIAADRRGREPWKGD